MGKKHKNSSTASDDDDKTKRRNEPSTSTNLGKRIGQSVLKPCSESKSNLKKQKIHKEKSEETLEDKVIVSNSEMTVMKKSIKDLSEDMKKIQEVLLTNAHLLGVSLKRENPEENEEAKEICCFDCEDAKGNDDQTIFVKGFEKLRTRDEIKKALSSFFFFCGDITRVFVPIECKTRVPLGFAFINLKNGKGNHKAFALNGKSMGGRKLEVTLAKDRDEYYGFDDFSGCERCGLMDLHARAYDGSGMDDILFDDLFDNL